MTTPSEKRGGRGGRRAGAGRPPTYRRLTLDAEAAAQLAELVRVRRAACPQARWTAAAIVNYLITEAYAREVAQPPQQEQQV